MATVTLPKWVESISPTLEAVMRDIPLCNHLLMNGESPYDIDQFEDYAKDHPYSQRYHNGKTGTTTDVFQELPMVDHEGRKCDPLWIKDEQGYHAGNNTFEAKITNTSVWTRCRGGYHQGKTVEWHPQLFVDDIEYKALRSWHLELDPLNPDFSWNVVEYDYGVCKRRLRLLQGRIYEQWVFDKPIKGHIKIKHNHSGDYPLRIGQGARGVFASDDDTEEIILDRATRRPFLMFASAAFVPDVHPETSSVDGNVATYHASGTWADLKACTNVCTNATSDGSTEGGTDAIPFISMTALGTASNWGFLIRSIFVLDTGASLAALAVISAVTFAVRGTDKNKDSTFEVVANIYEAAPAANNALAAGDFDSLGTTAYCDTGISYTSWSVAGDNSWAFNATGRAAIGIGAGNVTKLGMRDSYFDVGANAPTWAAWNGGDVAGWFADHGSLKPTLTVTYTAPPTVVSAAATVGGETATLNGEVTVIRDTGIVERGFVWDTASHAQPADGTDPAACDYNGPPLPGYEKETIGQPYSTGVFTYDLTGLSPGTTYYFRAFAKNSVNYAYSPVEQTFTTFTHRISNLGTSGIKVGGALVPDGTQVFLVDLVNKTLTECLTGAGALAQGFFQNDACTFDDAIPKYAAFCVYDKKASLTHGAANAGLIFTAKITDGTHWYPGEAGNDLAIEILNNATHPETVSVAAAVITVNMTLNTSTATDIKNAIEANADANKMVSVALVGDGSGFPIALVHTHLAGGEYFTELAYTFITPAAI